MVLKIVGASESSKLGGIGCTYRSGATDIWTTCAENCPFLVGDPEVTEFDHEYMMAEFLAEPRAGEAWSYTATWRSYLEVLPLNREGRTVINMSATSMEEAEELRAKGRDVVVSLPKDTPLPKGYVPCPAERPGSGITCSNCGAPGSAL